MNYMEIINGNKDIFSSIVIFLITFCTVKITNRFFKHSIKNNNTNITSMAFLRRIIISIFWLVGICAIMLQFEYFQKFATSILASSGVLAVIFGFAAQEAMGNIISGIFISVFKPFVINDRVKIASEGIDGTVEDISMRHTVIKTISNSRIIVPNSIINKSVLENVTYADASVCNFLEIGISYDADMDMAIEIIKKQVLLHENFCDNRGEEEVENNTDKVVVRVVGFGDYSVKLRTEIWSENIAKGFVMLCDLRYSIKKEFDKNGIDIPARVLCVKDGK